jgi:hypothetical protein
MFDPVASIINLENEISTLRAALAPLGLIPEAPLEDMVQAIQDVADERRELRKERGERIEQEFVLQAELEKRYPELQKDSDTLTGVLDTLNVDGEDIQDILEWAGRLRDTLVKLKVREVEWESASEEPARWAGLSDDEKNVLSAARDYRNYPETPSTEAVLCICAQEMSDEGPEKQDETPAESASGNAAEWARLRARLAELEHQLHSEIRQCNRLVGESTSEAESMVAERNAYAAETLALRARVAELEAYQKQGSDGYHTFEELYEHRHVLFGALLACAGGGWKSKQHADGSMFPGWFIAGMTARDGLPVTYHLPERLWEDFPGRAQEKAPEWDGHTPADVVTRIRGLWVADGPSQMLEEMRGQLEQDFRRLESGLDNLVAATRREINGLIQVNSDIRAQNEQYQVRAAALEAPPIVPPGFRVFYDEDPPACWCWTCKEDVPGWTDGPIPADLQWRVELARAWAAKNNKVPPHASSDGQVGG